ncbi:MAG: hypothetical protein CR997_04545 [Acidobacteria bacterium]|nr:MAG: hypothetical protein CR997_04545 [Acidobacteriota bacterium]
MNTYLELNKFNHIRYLDEGHRYLIDNREMISVTTFIGLYKQVFDREGHSLRCAQKKGVSAQQILDEWDLKKEIACAKGIHFHRFAENYLANKEYPHSREEMEQTFGDASIVEELLELQKMFKQFYLDSSRNLVPVRSEWVVGDADLGICGMVDQLYFNKKSGQLELWDWKTNKAISRSSPYQKKMLGPVAHLDECEYNLYSLQLSLYKYIIEKNTDLRLGNSYLAWFHVPNGNYRIFRCDHFAKELQSMLADYQQSQQKQMEGV